MAEVTAALVKELRERTSAGMMDCKKALVETGAEIEAAVDWLRKEGLAAASKKAGRVASEGLVGVATGDGIGALVEVNSETDFVARNPVFQDFVRLIAEVALAHHGDIEAIRAADYPDSDRDVAKQISHLVATVGEKLNLRRAAVVEADPGVVVGYVHRQVAPGLGAIGVIIGLQSSGDRERLAALGKQLAMHVAWAVPQALSIGDLDPAVLARERKLLTDQARASGKPEDIVEKMVEGRLCRFYEQVVLLEQICVIDGKTKLSKVLEDAANDVGGAVKIVDYRWFVLGEGVEKMEKDFAAEVAAQLNQ